MCVLLACMGGQFPSVIRITRTIKLACMRSSCAFVSLTDCGVCQQELPKAGHLNAYVTMR